MFEVIVTSPKGQFANARFETEVRAQEYIDRHSGLGTWGRPDEWVPASALTEEQIREAKQSKEEDGETYCLIEGEFTAEIVDVTLEVEALKAKEAAKLAYEESLKTKVQTWQNLSSKDKDDLLRDVVAKVLGVEFER